MSALIFNADAMRCVARRSDQELLLAGNSRAEKWRGPEGIRVSRIPVTPIRIRSIEPGLVIREVNGNLITTWPSEPHRESPPRVLGIWIDPDLRGFCESAIVERILGDILGDPCPACEIVKLGFFVWLDRRRVLKTPTTSHPFLPGAGFDILVVPLRHVAIRRTKAKLLSFFRSRGLWYALVDNSG